VTAAVLVQPPPPRRGLTLRRFLTLLALLGLVYVASITVVIGGRIAPRARALQMHSTTVLAISDAIRDRLATLGGPVEQTRAALLAGDGERDAGLRTLIGTIRSRLDTITAVQTARALDDAPPEMRILLAEAAVAEGNMGLALLDALAAKELGRQAGAAASWRTADSLRGVTEAALQRAQRLALAEMLDRERALTGIAAFAGRAVVWWLVTGVLALPLVVLYLRRHLDRPLRDLERALSRVAAGDLSTALTVERLDEIGQLAHHFNEMTRVLRERAEDERAEGDRRVEDALRLGEERYRAAFEHAALGMCETDLAGRFLQVNPALCAFLGYGREELIGRRLSEVTDPDGGPDGFRAATALAGTRPTARSEVRFRRRDGTAAWGNLTAAPVRHPDGAPAYWVSIIEDVTERRSLQAQLAESQRLESVGQLAGGVAHDFNNLLTAILGYLRLVADQLEEGHPARADLEEIDRAAQRASNLTGQLLAFARRRVVAPRVVDLNAVAAGLDRLLRRLITEDIELINVLSPDLGRTRIDPTQLEQVVVNLVLNARDAMPGGGRLTIETRNVTVSDGDRPGHADVAPGPYVQLAVSDTGHGMDEATRARVFEPFFTTKDRTKGTGLGLATAWGIVRQAGGHIWVHSEPGRGATFTVLLPRVEAAVEGGTDAPAEAPARSGSETVLLVEDERAVRDVLARGLRERGYRVLCAADGAEALDLARAHRASLRLLITDVVLPILNGRELAHRLAEELPGLSVLYISGYAEEAVVHHGVVEPGVAFLSKPFSAEELARRVRQLLDARVTDAP
jgi:PAS domain S-box-containing protein